MDNFLSDEWLLIGTMFGVVVVVVFYQAYNRAMSLKSIEKMLIDHYREQGNEVVSISKLKAADKIKYGIPLNPFLSFYTSSFKLFSAPDESYHRIVETKDSSGKEYLRYVEVAFSGKRGITVNEFDCYEF
ncbi:hypothetical protein [Maribellus sp. YY47]|uniref:hypothetical protein n=1 Tax=Maribellus sp. YY47 TaxID=2929486 RepID=UPI002000B3F4|nr:hypothetical protein [Maribellus sp. YY47]MCK3685318.1 hypothetical protein [Maribellus sp. YY47]